MNKADLIDMVASETGSTKVDAAKALDAVVDAVTEHYRTEILYR